MAQNNAVGTYAGFANICEYQTISSINKDKKFIQKERLTANQKMLCMESTANDATK